MFGLGYTMPEALAAPNSSAAQAKALVSQATGLSPDELIVGREALLGDSGIRRMKLIDGGGRVFGIALDETGNRASGTAVKDAIAEMNQKGFVGKLDAGLAQRLSAARDSGPMRVILWLKDTANQTQRQAGQTDETREAGLASRVAVLQQPSVNQLRSAGQEVIYQSQYAPAVVVSASTPAIRAMEARDDVERIYLERTHQPRLNISKLVVQATTVHGRGINGAGVRVGVVERYRIGAHANLPAARRILCRPTASTTVSSHKTTVAGIVQSTNASQTGMASSVTVVDGIGANFGDAEMMAATDCVISQGATAINMSFGSNTNGVFDAFARFVDTVSHNTRRTIVVAVSNDCGKRMGSPEIAFNSLAVGAFGDNNTQSFAGDVPPCTGAVTFSAFLDPLSPHSDREQPNIVAPGHLISTTIAGGGFGSANGTSFAAPHVTGGIGLLQDRSFIFNTQGERARAIMMASARHNIEGASRLSERDGAGGIMLAAADRVLLNGQSFFTTKPGGTTGFPHNQTFSATAGQKVRVVTVWSHKMPLGSAMTEPTTDLDLTVLRPGSAVVGRSLSFDNSYEIVEFTAPVTGTYTARIANFRASAGTEFIGLAVSRSDS